MVQALGHTLSLKRNMKPRLSFRGGGGHDDAEMEINKHT